MTDLDEHISFLYTRMSKLALSKLSFEVDSINESGVYDQRGDESTNEFTFETRDNNSSEGSGALLNAEAISLSLQRTKNKRKTMLSFSSFKKSLKGGNFDIKEPLICAHREENRIQPTCNWETDIQNDN